MMKKGYLAETQIMMEVAMEERRRSARRELVSSLIVKRLDDSRQEEITIEIQDVSKTGIGFTCEEALEIGAVYESFLMIWTKEVLHAFLEIVRIEKKEGGFFYGAIFIGMPEMDAARIEVYDTVENMKDKK